MKCFKLGSALISTCVTVALDMFIECIAVNVSLVPSEKSKLLLDNNIEKFGSPQLFTKNYNHRALLASIYCRH